MSIRTPLSLVILSEAKNLRGSNYEILRRLAPQNDTHKRGFRMGIRYFRIRLRRISGI